MVLWLMEIIKTLMLLRLLDVRYSNEIIRFVKINHFVFVYFLFIEHLCINFDIKGNVYH